MTVSFGLQLVTSHDMELRNNPSWPISRNRKFWIFFILTLSPPDCLMAFCKVTLTFESVDEILWCDHSNESSLPILSHDAICLSQFWKMKFGNLVETFLWPHLAVKGWRDGTNRLVYRLQASSQDLGGTPHLSLFPARCTDHGFPLL